jgi:TatD DNase family protein
MIALVDSHAHLDMPEFDPDRTEVLARAWQAGVRSLLCPADITNPVSLARVLDMTGSYSWVAAAAGVHPHQAKDFEPAHLETIRRLAKEGKIVAVGEIGLDYHYDLSPPEKQREAFRAQLRLAGELGLPAIIHSRKAAADIVAAVAAEDFCRGGILHCFTEDRITAWRMMDRGFAISFSGILTYPSAGDIRQIAADIPGGRLLVETDSPYLTPSPLRRRAARNEPAFVVETARRLADLRKIPLDALAPQLLLNFQTLYPNMKSV